MVESGATTMASARAFMYRSRVSPARLFREFFYVLCFVLRSPSMMSRIVSMSVGSSIVGGLFYTAAIQTS